MKISRAQKEIRLQTIKAESLKLLKKEEFSKVTVEKIIKNCKIAKGTFFNYFESKEHLALCLLEEAGRTAYANFYKNLERSKKTSMPIYELMMDFLDLSFYAFRNMEFIVYASLSFPVLPGSQAFEIQKKNKTYFVKLCLIVYKHSQVKTLKEDKIEILWHLYLGVLRQWALEKQIKKTNAEHVKFILKGIQESFSQTCNISKLRSSLAQTLV